MDVITSWLNNFLLGITQFSEIRYRYIKVYYRGRIQIKIIQRFVDHHGGGFLPEVSLVLSCGAVKCYPFDLAVALL